MRTVSEVTTGGNIPGIAEDATTAGKIAPFEKM
jgi:hypothetical protein